MKKLVFLALAALAVSCGRVPEGMFVIEGRVPSLTDSTMLILLHPEGMDTTYVVNGSFSFRNPLSEKSEVSLFIPPSEELPDRSLDFWAEPGQKAVIRGDNNTMRVWSVKSRIPEQRELEYYKQALRAEWEEYQRNDDRQYKLRSANDLSEESRNQAMAQLRSQEREIEYRIFDKELDLMAGVEPGTIFLEELRGIGMMIFHHPEPFGPLKERAIAQYDRLTDEQKTSEPGQELTRSLYPPVPVEIGGEMADVELPDLSGTMHKLSDYKGKYILLDFWYAACGPCIRAMPELREFSKQYADWLTIVGINIDPHGIWSEATEKLGVTWVNLNAPGVGSEVATKYRALGFPHQVLISPEGVVLGIWDGYGEGHLREQLKKYIPSAIF